MQFGNIYKGMKVLITGHTGFKGSWLSLWLHELGAKVIGYSLPPATSPNHFDQLNLYREINSINGDIRDLYQLKKTFEETSPEIIFHLAAQPIVIKGFQQPLQTFEINSQGTVNVLEACRTTPSIQSAVFITTDKCYLSQQRKRCFSEEDPLGGNDPYSTSKVMAEWAIMAYRESYFKDRKMGVASVRAGNVIGGGDFSPYRLVPDCMSALVEKRPIQVRHPDFTRPWFHVFDCLRGYLMLGAHLLHDRESFTGAWNFGPLEKEGATLPLRLSSPSSITGYTEEEVSAL